MLGDHDQEGLKMEIPHEGGIPNKKPLEDDALLTPDGKEADSCVERSSCACVFMKILMALAVVVLLVMLFAK